MGRNLFWYMKDRVTSTTSNSLKPLHFVPTRWMLWCYSTGVIKKEGQVKSAEEWNLRCWKIAKNDWGPPFEKVRDSITTVRNDNFHSLIFSRLPDIVCIGREYIQPNVWMKVQVGKVNLGNTRISFTPPPYFAFLSRLSKIIRFVVCIYVHAVILK